MRESQGIRNLRRLVIFHTQSRGEGNELMYVCMLVLTFPVCIQISISCLGNGATHSRQIFPTQLRQSRWSYIDMSQTNAIYTITHWDSGDSRLKPTITAGNNGWKTELGNRWWWINTQRKQSNNWLGCLLEFCFNSMNDIHTEKKKTAWKEGTVWKSWGVSGAAKGGSHR